MFCNLANQWSVAGRCDDPYTACDYTTACYDSTASEEPASVTVTDGELSGEKLFAKKW